VPPVNSRGGIRVEAAPIMATMASITFRTLVVLCLGGSVACARGPVELGFWMAPLAYQSPRIGAAITDAEFAVIDNVARGEIVEGHGAAPCEAAGRLYAPGPATPASSGAG